MAVTDVDIADWKDDYLGDDTNSPRDTDSILTNLDDEVRNTKALVRRESDRKPWMPLELPIALIPGPNSILFDGDVQQEMKAGRWMRVHSPTEATDKYFLVKSTVFTGTGTIVQIGRPYVFQGLMPTDSPFVTRVSDSVVTATGDVTGDYVAGRRTIFFEESTGLIYVKKIDSAVFASGTTTITFESDDAIIPSGAFYLFVESDDSPLSDTDRVYIATFDSDPHRSAQVHFSQAGQVEISQDTTVLLPRPEADSEYVVLLTVVDRPGTGSDYESLLFAQNQTEESFDILFNVDPIDEDEGSGGVVKIDWILLRYIQPFPNCDTDGH